MRLARMKPVGKRAIAVLSFAVVPAVLLATILLSTGVVVSAQERGEPPLNVAFLWHQHQPLYTDPATGEAALPWVRMHAIKDYYDMAAILKEYPSLRATFNLVPSLIDQLERYAEGDPVDLYQKMAQIPADRLDDSEKAFLLRRFFDANWEKVVGRFPRYKELLEKRGAGAGDEEIEAAMARFTTEDYRDLQVWFDLAWFDPGFLRDDPELAALVRKGRGFTEEDKETIRRKELEIIRSVIPLHREMQESGQIEVITTPYAHPIMPLLYNVETARIASPGLDLPALRFAHPEDIDRHLALARENYRAHFGTEPRGLWPSEQAVSKYIVPHIAQAGFSWMVSSEGVLAKSLGLQLRGISGEVVRPDLMYQPYWAEHDGARVAILFRDIVLSDRVGFEYSGTSGSRAADDLIAYLHRVRRSLGESAGEKVVLIALDGENAWEHYENDGKEFFHALYRRLADDPLLKTVTISGYLAEHPPTAVLSDLWTGSWISDNLETWIGEAEENLAWRLLAAAREVLETYVGQHGDDPERRPAIDRAWKAMVAAQGSDWFWWYGSDQDSGNDGAFDALFRGHLIGVYTALDLEPPARLFQPIVAPPPAKAARALSGLSAPRPDGWADPGEWDAAAYYTARAADPLPAVADPHRPRTVADTDQSRADEQADGAQADEAQRERLLKALYLAVDNQHLTVRVDWTASARELIGEPIELFLYLDHPRHESVNETTRRSLPGRAATLLGYPVAYEVRLDLENAPRGLRPVAPVSVAAGGGAWDEMLELRQTGIGSAFEVRIPFEELDFRPGEALRVTAVAARGGVDVDRLPDEGPATIFVPRSTEGRLLFRADDPPGDDYGPGAYTYPTNEVFTPGVFDLESFEVYETEQDVIFHVQLAGPIENVWGSPIGLSVQTVDIYIDTDRVPGSGSVDALAGRRVQIAPESAWEYAVWVEGWHQKLFSADGSELQAAVRAVTDPIHRRVTIQVPKSAIGAPQPGWGYIVLVLGQEGFPASDSLRVREVMRVAQEWRFGGGDDSGYDPNVIDLLAPAGVQEAALGSYDVAGRRFAVIGAVYPE